MYKCIWRKAAEMRIVKASPDNNRKRQWLSKHLLTQLLLFDCEFMNTKVAMVLTFKDTARHDGKRKEAAEQATKSNVFACTDAVAVWK